MIIEGLVFSVGAYFIGSIPMGLLFGGLLFKKDVRQSGSGNIGATNAYRVLGPFAGIIIFGMDFLKGALPVLVFTLIVPDRSTITFQSFQVIVALSAMLGHIYSVFLNFSGGKGVATAAGVLAVLSWKVTLILFVIWVFLLAIFRYVSLASVTIAVALPFLALFIERGNLPFILFSLAGAFLVIYKHRANIQRIIKGEEPKILERS